MTLAQLDALMNAESGVIAGAAVPTTPQGTVDDLLAMKALT